MKVSELKTVEELSPPILIYQDSKENWYHVGADNNEVWVIPHHQSGTYEWLSWTEFQHKYGEHQIQNS